MEVAPNSTNSGVRGYIYTSTRAISIYFESENVEVTISMELEIDFCLICVWGGRGIHLIFYPNIISKKNITIWSFPIFVVKGSF